MASLTIRKLDDDVKERLRVRAARSGRSMEEEARAILGAAVSGVSGPDLLKRAKALFGAKHGVDLELPKRRAARAAPDFKA